MAKVKSEIKALQLFHIYRAMYISFFIAITVTCLISLCVAMLMENYWVLLVFSALSIFMIFAFCLRLKEFHTYKHLPGPKPSFFLGNLKALLSQEHTARDQALLNLHQKYGPVVKLHLGWGSVPFVSVCYPSNLVQGNVDSNRQADRTVLGNSLMGMPSGEKHREHRSKLNPHFTPKAVKLASPRLLAITSDYLETWKKGKFRHSNLKSDLHYWSAHTMGIFLASSDWEKEADLSHYLSSIATLEDEISFRAFHPPFVRWIFFLRNSKSRGAYRYLYRFIQKVFNRRSTRNSKGGVTVEKHFDVLEMLLHLKHKQEWRESDCIEELISLVAGGTDAVSYTMSQALILLANNPDVQKKAFDYVKNISISQKDYIHPYIKNIIYETMRLYPAVPFSSKRMKQASLDQFGVHIPKNTNLMWMKTAIGKNENLFQVPEQFYPERYETSLNPQKQSIKSVLPFGAGIRHCIGSHLAEYLCFNFLTDIIKTFELLPIEGLEIDYKATVSVSPSLVPVRLVCRSPEVARSRLLSTSENL